MGFRPSGVISYTQAKITTAGKPRAPRRRRLADGAWCKTIAAELNRRGVPSPGSSWKRVTRRAKGWMGSGVRVILRNEPVAPGSLGGGRSGRSG